MRKISDDNAFTVTRYEKKIEDLNLLLDDNQRKYKI